MGSLDYRYFGKQISNSNVNRWVCTEALRINKSSKGKDIIMFSKASTGLRCACKARLIYEDLLIWRAKANKWCIISEIFQVEKEQLWLCMKAVRTFFSLTKWKAFCLAQKKKKKKFYHSTKLVRAVYLNNLYPTAEYWWENAANVA